MSPTITMITQHCVVLCFIVGRTVDSVICEVLTKHSSSVEKTSASEFMILTHGKDECLRQYVLSCHVRLTS